MATTSQQPNILSQVSDQLAGIVSSINNSVVSISSRHRNTATGVLWREGLIVTAAHAVKRKGDVTVIAGEGKEATAQIAGIDLSLDLALLKIEKSSLSLPEIDETLSYLPGNLVIAAGRGSDGSLGGCLGIVGNVSGPWQRWGGTQIDRYVELDMKFVPGFYGSPLLNTEGKVMGIVSVGLSSRAVVLIPAITINRVIEPLLEKGSISRGYIGVGLYPANIPSSLASKLSTKQEEGLAIISLEENGPAEKAGILVGDILLTVNGKPVTEAQDVQTILNPDTIGNEISVVYLRGGEEKQLKIAVGERPHKNC